MDTTVIVALITTIAAIISPIITALITSRKEYKVKKLEIVYQEKLKAFNEFADAYAKLTRDENKRREFHTAASKSALYIRDKNTRISVLRLGNFLCDDTFSPSSHQNEFSDCIMKIVDTKLK